MNVPLTLRDVHRSFGGQARVHALTSIDLEIHPGDYLAVTGKSGSGKSTLLNVLGLLERPTAGTYIIGAEDTTMMRPGQRDDLRMDTFGLVFQSFHLIDYFTTAENVEVGLTYAGLSPRRRRERVEQVIDHVGLSHRAAAPTATLSGGERQRVAIARTLARHPKVLLADEPTGNLDEENGAAILDLFDRINADGVTVVLVTHDGDTASRCPRRIVLRDGQIAEDARTGRPQG